ALWTCCTRCLRAMCLWTSWLGRRACPNSTWRAAFASRPEWRHINIKSCCGSKPGVACWRRETACASPPNVRGLPTPRILRARSAAGSVSLRASGRTRTSEDVTKKATDYQHRRRMATADLRVGVDRWPRFGALIFYREYGRSGGPRGADRGLRGCVDMADLTS